jgi:SAM-dependent methyltransferase
MAREPWEMLNRAFQDYLDGRKDARLRVHWDSGDIQDMEVAHFFRPLGQMPALEKRALSLCRGRVLDVGAGTGVHATVLQRRGLEVVAVEPMPAACEAMRRRGLANIVEGSFFDLPPSGDFNTLLFMMNGLGVAGTLERLDRFFVQCGQLLAPDGIIIGDSTDIFVSLDLDPDLAFDRYPGELSFRVEYQGRLGQPEPWLFVDFGTLSEAARRHGFRASMREYGQSGSYLALLQRRGNSQRLT